MGIQEQTPEPVRDVARDDVVVAANRCPYCHSDVDAEADDGVACKGCLARHHQSCWDEAGKCSACGGEQALVAQPQVAASRDPGAKTQTQRRLAALAFGVLVAMFVPLLLLQKGPEPVAAPPVQVEAPAPDPVAPEGTVEVDIAQRSSMAVEGLEGFDISVGDVKAIGATRFNLSVTPPGEGPWRDDGRFIELLMRVGDSETVELDGRRYTVHFLRQLQSAFGEDRAIVWITPLD